MKPETLNKNIGLIYQIKTMTKQMMNTWNSEAINYSALQKTMEECDDVLLELYQMRKEQQ